MYFTDTIYHAIKLTLMCGLKMLQTKVYFLCTGPMWGGGHLLIKCGIYLFFYLFIIVIWKLFMENQNHIQNHSTSLGIFLAAVSVNKKGNGKWERQLLVSFGTFFYPGFQWWKIPEHNICNMNVLYSLVASVAEWIAMPPHRSKVPGSILELLDLHTKQLYTCPCAFFFFFRFPVFLKIKSQKHLYSENVTCICVWLPNWLVLLGWEGCHIISLECSNVSAWYTVTND